MDYRVIPFTREALSLRIDEADQSYTPQPKLNSRLPGYEITSVTYSDESPDNSPFGIVEAQITFWGDQNFLEIEQIMTKVVNRITQDGGFTVPLDRLVLPDPFVIKNQIALPPIETRVEDQYTIILPFQFSVFEKIEC